MKNWLKVDITTYVTTGVEEVTYSHTPEAFIERLRSDQDVVWVTNKACAECVYFTRHESITQEMITERDKEMLRYHRAMECIRCATARWQRRSDIPDFIGCYTFFYKHYAMNKYIKAAIQADLLTSYDVEKLPTLKDIGGRLSIPNWYY